MDVSVLYKRAQRLLHWVHGPAILGDGMLERARATSLALLGLTAAVGLAIVALAANQGWPLIAGSSLPRTPPLHRGVGKATVVAVAHPGPARAAEDAPPGSAADRAQPSGGGAAAGAPKPAAAELVVAPSDPAQSQDGPASRSPGHAQPAPSHPQPAAKDQPPSASSPAAPPTDVVEATPPEATVSESPPVAEESYVPPWSNGKGHAYGRSGRSSGSGDEEDED